MNRRDFLKSLVASSVVVAMPASAKLTSIFGTKEDVSLSAWKKGNLVQINFKHLDSNSSSLCDYLHGEAQMVGDDDSKKSFCFMIDPNVEIENEVLLQQIKGDLYKNFTNKEYRHGSAWFSRNGLRDPRAIIGMSM